MESNKRNIINSDVSLLDLSSGKHLSICLAECKKPLKSKGCSETNTFLNSDPHLIPLWSGSMPILQTKLIKSNFCLEFPFENWYCPCFKVISQCSYSVLNIRVWNVLCSHCTILFHTRMELQQQHWQVPHSRYRQGHGHSVSDKDEPGFSMKSYCSSTAREK